ncbi:MAG: hypothetical protein WCT01_02325 [Candidatus Shapirobacteria bacterium]
MEEIKTGGIKMTPRWIFWAWEAGIKSVWAALLLMGAVGGSAIIFFWGRYEPVNTIREYGEVGREVIVSEFPYWWLTMGIFSLLAGTFMLTKVGRMYRETLSRLMVWMAGAIMVASVVFKLLKIAG